MFDFVIKNGLVADGESEELLKADVAISGDTIAAIEPDIDRLAAKETIDAESKIVAPGFVDAHSHSDYYLLIDPRARSKVLQGVTTEIGGNCGYAAAPMNGEVLKQRSKDYQEQFGVTVNWSDLEEYFKALSDAGPSVNYAALAGYNTVRGSVMGPEARAPRADEMKEIKKTIARALDQGAFGMSVGIVYPPACFADRDEFVEAFSEVAKRDKVFATHIRSEGAFLLESLEEVVDVAKRSGARLQVSHLKTAGEANWNKLDRAFDLLESAGGNGLRIMADRYPYLASNTGLQVVLPDRAFDGGREGLLNALRSGKERKAFRHEVLENHPSPEYWDTVMVSQVITDKNKDMEGLTVNQGASARGKDAFDFVFDLLVEENAQVEAIFFCMNEGNLERIVRKPWVMIGSDAGAKAADGPLSTGRSHPRTFGTFPRFYKEFVREKKMFTIPQAVRKTSVMACDFFGIEKRGRLKKGYYSDIVVFDPETIGDTASYHAPHSYPVGIEAVFVNGEPAVKNGRPLDKRPGRIISR